MQQLFCIPCFICNIITPRLISKVTARMSVTNYVAVFVMVLVVTFILVYLSCRYLYLFKMTYFMIMITSTHSIC